MQSIFLLIVSSPLFPDFHVVSYDNNEVNSTVKASLLTIESLNNCLLVFIYLIVRCFLHYVPLSQRYVQ